jgi:hypothetical protein
MRLGEGVARVRPEDLPQGGDHVTAISARAH